jgi:hypothetical protein
LRGRKVHKSWFFAGRSLGGDRFFSGEENLITRRASGRGVVGLEGLVFGESLEAALTLLLMVGILSVSTGSKEKGGMAG